MRTPLLGISVSVGGGHAGGQCAAAHLLELRAGRHLLGEQGRLDAVEQPLEPTDQLRLRDAKLRLGRRLARERQRDLGELQRAKDLWQGMGARPYVARIQHEIGRLTGDRDALEAGRRELERLGDVDYLDRADAARS